MKKILAPLLAVVSLCVSLTSNAQISASDLPSMGNLAKLIGETDQSTVEDSIYNDEGKISSGMVANDSARGETALVIAGILSEGNEDKQIEIAGKFGEVRVAFEEILTSANFAQNDAGVGIAASFITLWELASERTLPDEAALKIGKHVVHSFGTPEAVRGYNEFSDIEKGKFYDWMMTTPVVFAALVSTFEAEGLKEEALKLREKSASLFIEVFKIPHTYFIMSDEGELNIDIDLVQSYQVDNGLSEDW